MSISKRLALALTGLLSLYGAELAAEERRLDLILPSGTQVQARLIVPQRVNAPLPAIVLLGGFDRGGAALDLLPRDDRAVLVGFDYPLALPDKIRWQQIPRLARDIERGIDDTLAATILLRERLAQMPEVDPERVTLVGVSLGAPFAAIAGARADYPGVALLHGFGDLPGTIRHQFLRRWEPEYGRLGTAAAWAAEWAITALVSLPIPEQEAERLDSNQKVLWVTASEDEFVPRSAVESMREALRRSQASTSDGRTEGSHVRGRNPQAVSELLTLTTAWMQEQGLLDPPVPRAEPEAGVDDSGPGEGATGEPAKAGSQ